MSRPKYRLLILAGIGAVILAGHFWILAGLGHFLVAVDQPSSSDAIVVLAGDRYGHRVLCAGDLMKKRLAPVALVSGPPYYSITESDLAIDLAVRHGHRREWFVSVPNTSTSTVEEAQALHEALRQRGARSVLVVTSNYHTARAGRIWRKEAPELRVEMVAAQDANFDPKRWWLDREGRKIFFFEWSKTVTSPLGF